jgi:hypothetical protein
MPNWRSGVRKVYPLICAHLTLRLARGLNSRPGGWTVKYGLQGRDYEPSQRYEE